MNFLPTLVRFAFFFYDGSIFWHGDGLFRHAKQGDPGAVSPAVPHAGKDVGQGAAWSAAVGPGRWLGQWPMSGILLQCMKAVVGPVLRYVGRFRPMLGVALWQCSRKQPQFPASGIVYPVLSEAQPSVKCSDVQAAQLCAHSSRCSPSIAASNTESSVGEPSLMENPVESRGRQEYTAADHAL